MNRKILATTGVVLLLVCASAWALTKLSGVALINSTVNSTPIGATTASTGKFTTVQIGSGTVLTGTQGNSGTVQQAGTIAGTGSMLCTDASGNTTSSGCTVTTGNSTTLISNVSGSTSVAGTVMTIARTMPAVGCPCRVLVSYSLYLSWAVGSPAVDFWISDGTTTFAGVQTATSNGGSGGRTSASYAGFSTVTYANGASVTFTLLNLGTSGTFTIEAAPQTGAGPNSSMQVFVMPSN